MMIFRSELETLRRVVAARLQSVPVRAVDAMLVVKMP
jgi:hypothetical protein